MESSNLDFSKMMFPAHLIDNSIDILRSYPNLKLYPEFIIPPKKDKDEEYSLINKFGLTKVFRFIVFAYDRKSPLVSNLTMSVIKRKTEALLLAGFIIDEDNDDIFNIVTCRNRPIAKLIGRYCRIQHNMKFTSLMSKMDAHYNETEYLRTETDASKRTACLKNQNQLEEEIDTLVNTILSGDNAELLKEEIYAQIEMDELGIMPEDIAKKLIEGVNPLGDFNPHVK